MYLLQKSCFFRLKKKTIQQSGIYLQNDWKVGEIQRILFWTLGRHPVQCRIQNYLLTGNTIQVESTKFNISNLLQDSQFESSDKFKAR